MNSTDMDISNRTAVVLAAFGGHISHRKSDPIPTIAIQRFHAAMTGVWLLISLTGVTTNILNLRTFVRIGLEDSVTVSFFALSISDFNVCSLSFIGMFGFLGIILQREFKLWFQIPPAIPTFFFWCVRRVFTTTTVLITTFLALQRCVCVVFPFKVRDLFTRSRTCTFMVCIFCFSAISFSLYTWRHQVRKTYNNATGISQLSLYILPGSESIFFLIEVILGIGLNISCQIIVLLCCIVMALALRKAVQFRKSATSADRKLSKDIDNRSSVQERTKSKEIQALTQVTFLSVIFVVAGMPYLFYGAANLLMPEFGLNQDYHNLYQFVHNIMFTCEVMSSCVNFVVYYNCNTKFRRHCFKSDQKHARDE